MARSNDPFNGACVSMAARTLCPDVGGVETGLAEAV